MPKAIRTLARTHKPVDTTAFTGAGHPSAGGEPLEDDIPPQEPLMSDTSHAEAGLQEPPDEAPLTDELLDIFDSGQPPLEPDAGAPDAGEPSFEPDFADGAPAAGLESSGSTSSAKAPALVAVPELQSKSTLDYALDSNSFDQRPAYALAMAMRAQASLSKQLADTANTVERAAGVVKDADGFAARGRDQLAAWVFGDGGLVSQLKGIFATERELNRQAAKGGLLDAAEEVENLVERYGNAKRQEFDAHAISKSAELEREMHRITVTSLQTALQAIVEEKTALATQKAEYEARNRYATRMGIAYGLTGLFAGVVLALAAVFMR